MTTLGPIPECTEHSLGGEGYGFPGTSPSPGPCSALTPHPTARAPAPPPSPTRMVSAGPRPSPWCLHGLHPGFGTSPTTSHPLDSLRRLPRTVVQGPRALNLAVEGGTGWYSSLSCLEQEGHRDS